MQTKIAMLKCYSNKEENQKHHKSYLKRICMIDSNAGAYLTSPDKYIGTHF